MDKELDLKNLLAIIKKRIILILSITLICTILAAGASYYFMTPVYEASTKIVVNRASDRTSTTTADLMNEVNTNLRLIDTYKEIIKTPAIMDIVTSQYPDLQWTSERLTEQIMVSSVNNTQVMTLKIQDPSYERAAKTVNAISTVFKKEIANIYKVDNVSILSEAKLNIKPGPVKPRPVLNTAIAFVVGLMASFGLAFLLEYLNDTIKQESDATQLLGLPVLAVVPEFELRKENAIYIPATKEVQKNVTI